MRPAAKPISRSSARAASLGGDAPGRAGSSGALFERAQIEIAPGFAAPAGKTLLGEAGEAALPVAAGRASSGSLARAMRRTASR